MEYLMYILFLLIHHVVDVVCNTCYKTTSLGATIILTCNYECCGSSSSRYCCPSSSSSNGSTVGTVVGVLAVVAIISIIVLICKKKKYYRRGRGRMEVGPHHVQSVQVTHTTTVGHPQQTYPPMYNPGSYQQGYQRPPMYGHPGRPVQRPPPGHVSGQPSAPGGPLIPGYVPPQPTYMPLPPAYSAQPPPYNEVQREPSKF